MTKLKLSEAENGGAAVPADLLERLRLAPGDTVYVVDRPGGVLFTADPNFGAAMKAFDRARKQYAETFRRLSE